MKEKRNTNTVASVLLLSAAFVVVSSLAYAVNEGGGIPSIISKAVTFLEPASGQVIDDCATTTTTTTTGCHQITTKSSTASSTGLYSTFNQSADVTGQAVIFGTYGTVTALTGTNARSVLSVTPRGHASDATGVNSDGLLINTPAVTSGGNDIGIEIASGQDYAIKVNDGAAIESSSLRLNCQGTRASYSNNIFGYCYLDAVQSIQGASFGCGAGGTGTNAITLLVEATDGTDLCSCTVDCTGTLASPNRCTCSYNNTTTQLVVFRNSADTCSADPSGVCMMDIDYNQVQ